MAYYLALLSPTTFEAFARSDRSVAGVQIAHQGKAERVRPGDRFVCYVTKLSRWVGILEILEGPFTSTTPIFYPNKDPFIVRFRVKPVSMGAHGSNAR